MMTDQIVADAEALVKGWVDHWQREGRIDGGLDRLARADLVERVAAALAEAQPAPKKQVRTKADPWPQVPAETQPAPKKTRKKADG